ncbi:MAG: hypothetical protein LBB21_02540 [Holosporaceae bacterium]|nr:hypothetical protein [Holosporaceae bacterium]
MEWITGLKPVDCSDESLQLLPQCLPNLQRLHLEYCTSKTLPEMPASLRKLLSTSVSKSLLLKYARSGRRLTSLPIKYID